MIPYKWPVLRAVPPVEKRLEIMQAIEELAGQIEADRLRREQAEIAARRRLIDQVELTVHELWQRCHPQARSHVLKYNPDEPRVPAGNPHGGEWTSEGDSTADPQVAQILPPSLLFEDPLFVRPPLAEFPKDPKLPPGPGFEWRGQPGSQPGDPEGSWYNPKTDESLRPDMDHPPPTPPHWDCEAPDGQQYRWFPDGRMELKS